jgi:hypothetical protein
MMARKKSVDVGSFFYVRTVHKKQRAQDGKAYLHQPAYEANALNCFCERPLLGCPAMRLELRFPSFNLNFSVLIPTSVQFGHKKGYGHVDAESDKNQNQRRNCPFAFENFRYGTIDDPVGSDKRVAHLKTRAGKNSAPGVICFTYGFESLNGVFIDPVDWSSRLNFCWQGIVRHRFYRPPPGPLAAFFMIAFLAGAFFAAAFLAGAFFAAVFLAGAFFAAFLVAILLFLRIGFCHIKREVSPVVCNR